MARSTSVSAARYPLISFDYLIGPDVKMDFEARRSAAWHLIEFNDADGEDPYWGRKPMARFPEIVSDGRWHRAELNLVSCFAGASPQDQTLAIDGIRLMNWNVLCKMLPSACVS